MRSHSFAETTSGSSLLNPNATTTFAGSTGLSGLGGGTFGDISSHSSTTIALDWLWTSFLRAVQAISEVPSFGAGAAAVAAVLRC